MTDRLGQARPRIDERAHKRARLRIWESFNGCDCDPKLSRLDRCSMRAIRCNGRLAIVQGRLAELEANRKAVAAVLSEGNETNKEK